MSLSELAQRLERSFRTSEQLLTRLLARLQQRRTAWIAARPEQLQPATDLDALGVQLRAEDETRAAIVEQLSDHLALPPGVTAGDLHVNVSRVAAAIPPAAAQQLRHAANEATAIAKRVRRELALGKRLLGFSQRANESLLTDITSRHRAQNPHGYDRRARTSQGLGIGATAGSIVDGRM